MEYTITPRVPGVRPQDPPDYDGVTFVYVFTKVTDPWTQPPVQGNVTLVVANNQGFVAGMTVAIENAGYYEVVSTDALNRMTVMNFGTNYNVAPGSGILPGKITTTSLPGPPGGIGPQGPPGVAGAPGPIGPPLNLKGTVPTVPSLPNTGNTVNDMWNVISNGHAYGWTGTAPWIDLGPFTGPQGTTGSTGPAGPQGPQGAQGNQGPTGPAGTPGSSGSMGPQGVPGPTGPAGPQGAIGPQGPKGNDGTSVVLKGSVATHSALPATGNTLGDLWVTLDTSHGWVWSAGNVWSDVGPIQGPAGATGPAGPQGPQGATGTQGPQGNPGTTGAQGPAGSTGSMGPAGTAATVAVGTTTTGAAGTNAAVTNTGTPNAAVLAFTIPQGVAGAAGPTGSSAWTLVGGPGFTVPAYGASVTIAVADSSWVALGEWVYVDDSGGAGIAGQLVVTGKTPTSLTLFNPTGSSYPLASASNNGLMKQVSGNTTDFIDGTNNSQPLQPVIWSARLRSFNAIGNPNFECNQRVYPSYAAPIPVTTGSITVDRWVVAKNGLSTGAASCGQGIYGSGIQIPGTSYSISWASLLLTLTAQQASLVTGDLLWFSQKVESIMLRELISDVHSISILARSSVANLKFGIAIRDGAGAPTRSLTKLCSLGAANTWTLIQLPNLPLWSSAAYWPIGNGAVGYELSITLASGPTFMSPANDTWQTGNLLGAVGQSNFAANPVNSTFELAFVQHEPGSVCTTLMDKPFSQNLDECLRYYQKTYSYGDAPGAIITSGIRGFIAPGIQNQAYGTASFHKTMAKVPTINFWNHSTGVINTVMDQGGTNHTGAGVLGAGDAGFYGLVFSGPVANAQAVFAHYTADTGW